MHALNSHLWRRTLLALALTGLAVHVQAQFQFYGLGDFGGGYGEVRDATRTPGGIIAVGTATRFEGAAGDTAVMWTPAGGLVALPDVVINTTAWSFIAARVITPDGSVIGGSARDTATGNFREPALWTSNGTVVTGLGATLGGPHLPGQNQGANGLSANGSVAYGFACYDGTSRLQAFRYDGSGGIVALGFLNPGDVQSSPVPRGVSADGTVMAGNSFNADSSGFVGPGGLAFRYNYTGSGATGGTMVVLPLLAGGTWSYALVMTPDVSTIIGFADSPDFPNGQLVRWSNGGGTVEARGSPDPSFMCSINGGVSADGSVVVLYLGNDTTGGSYLRNSHGWFDFQAAMTSAGAIPAGWTGLGVSGLSFDSTLVYGNGLHNGVTEGWVAEVPPGFLRDYGADVTPPAIESLSAAPAVLWPPNNKMVAVTVTAVATDDIDPHPVVRIVSVTCNESAAGDWQITGPLTVKLKATRAGSGQGRVYTITVEARDAAGNVSTGMTMVTVPHDQGGK